MPEMTRDPRIDPRPGDVVVYGPQWQRERVDVVGIDDGFIHTKQGYGEHQISRPNWLKWMARAEVLHVGD